MRIYLFLSFLLISISVSPVFAEENKQDMVVAPASSPVFMPLDKYRKHPAANPRQEVYFPLKPRVMMPASKKIMPAKVNAPQYGPPYTPPPGRVDNASFPPPEPGSKPAGKNMTPDQAQQILSIYGSDK